MNGERVVFELVLGKIKKTRRAEETAKIKRTRGK